MAASSKLKFPDKKADRKRDNAKPGSKPKIQPFDNEDREPMPDGGCAVVLFEKRNRVLRSVAVIPLKSIQPGWTTVENLLMPYQLAMGFQQPVWTDLLRFRAYKKSAGG